MSLAAITGLRAEARIATHGGLAAQATGGVEAQVLAASQHLLAQGAEALVSFGIAGALAPGLAPGTLILPRAVIEEDGSRHAVEEAWHARIEAALAAAVLRVETGDILGATEPAASAARKAALFAKTGALAVDLESHLVARAAARAGKPFLVLRAIADPAMRDLPEAAVNGLDATGAPALGRILKSVARHPAQIAALLRLAGDTRRALFALRSAIACRPFEQRAQPGRISA